MATYSPAVERWRPIVAKYFPADQVDKALYVIQGESGGRPDAVGDGGAARGLFQIQDSRNFSSRPDATYLDDPENNIKYAAQQLGAAGGNWSAWGEGTSYNGKKFGALGNNPYPGSSGGTSMTSPASTANDRQAFANWARTEFGLNPPDAKDYPGTYVLDEKGKPTSALIPGSAAAAFQEAQSAYFKSLGSLAPIWNATKSPTAKGELSPDQKAQQDIKNKMDALDLQVKAGTLDAQKAATELTAFINEQKNALDLGKQQLDARAELDKYGPGGDFSYNDMGGAFADYAGRNGIDPTKSALRFTTPQPFDPAAAYKTNASTMGITGTPQPQNTMLDLIQKAMAGNDGATGSIGGAASGGLGDVGAAVSAAGDAMQPQYIIPGATVGAGAAPSGLSPDAITPYVPPWAGRSLQKPPQLVGGL